MAKILVIYGATPSHTLQQAKQLALTLRQSGHQTLLRAAEQLPEELSMQSYHGVMIGSQSYWGPTSLHNLRQREELRAAYSKTNYRPK